MNWCVGDPISLDYDRCTQIEVKKLEIALKENNKDKYFFILLKSDKII